MVKFINKQMTVKPKIHLFLLQLFVKFYMKNLISNNNK